MHNSTQKWMLWVIVSASSLVTIAAHALCGSAAGEPHALHNTRPPDTLAERLERPRPEQDSERQGALQVQLTPSEVVGLAQRAAKQTLGTSYEAYRLKRVMFDLEERSWFVTFTQSTSAFSPDGCLVVLVHDRSRETTSTPCR